MTKQEILARDAFERIIVAESKLPYSEAIHRARLLLRHGTTYHRLQEDACNGVGTWHGESNESFSKRQDRFERALERKEQQTEKRVRAIVAELGAGFTVTFGGDPRGCTMVVGVPSGKYDNWERSGICVPTS